MSRKADRVIRLGEVIGVHGVRGWIKVHSYTDPRSNLLEYRRWLLELHGTTRPVEVEAAAESGKRLIAKIAGVEDREGAASLVGAAIGVYRSALPELAPGEYYWTDLVGLSVRNLSGDRLGRVERLLATGANDVLVLDGGHDRLIPFIEGETVRRVDLESGEIVVDWDPSYWE